MREINKCAQQSTNYTISDIQLILFPFPEKQKAEKENQRKRIIVKAVIENMMIEERENEERQYPVGRVYLQYQLSEQNREENYIKRHK